MEIVPKILEMKIKPENRNGSDSKDSKRSSCDRKDNKKVKHKLWRKWDKKIKDKSHQEKGKHLDICIACYEKKKLNSMIV